MCLIGRVLARVGASGRQVLRASCISFGEGCRAPAKGIDGDRSAVYAGRLLTAAPCLPVQGVRDRVWSGPRPGHCLHPRIVRGKQGN